MIIHNFEQRSPEWFELRRGKFTGSKFGNLLAKKTTDTYEKLINRVVFEILSDTNVVEYVSDSMRRGTELEPDARTEYQKKTFSLVREVGSVQVNDYVLVSPDGLIGNDGGLEIKCLEYNNLIKFLTTQEIPRDYDYQIQGCIWACEREWWDYFVYHPDLDTEPLRVYRDDKKIKTLETELEIAINEVEERLGKLK